MKRMLFFILVLFAILSTLVCALADGDLQINGINIPMTSSTGEQLSTKEIDGTLYIPVEPLLKALGLTYTIDEESVSLTYTPSTDSNVDEYANLIPEEKAFVDILLEKVKSFKNPSSITVKSLLYIGDESIESKLIFANISAQNGFGGYTSSYYMIMYGEGMNIWLDSTAEKVAEFSSMAAEFGQPDFDYGRINRAIKQKVSELGY